MSAIAFTIGPLTVRWYGILSAGPGAGRRTAGSGRRAALLRRFQLALLQSQPRKNHRHLAWRTGHSRSHTGRRAGAVHHVAQTECAVSALG